VAGHRRQPVLHRAFAAAAPRCEVHRLRPGRERDGRGRPDPGRRRDSAGARVGWADDAVSRRRRVRTQKRGRRAPPFFTGEAGLPLLAGLLLPALGCFLCHCAHPPLHCGIQNARSCYRSQDRCRLARRPAARGARRFCRKTRACTREVST